MADKEKARELQAMIGAPIGQCAAALNETGGDIEAAKKILEERGVASVEKKSDRSFGSGCVAVHTHNEGRSGAMVELLCETDFVGKNDKFIELANKIAVHVCAMAPTYVRAEDVPTGETANASEVVLMEQPFLLDAEKTVQQVMSEATQEFGERIEVGQICRYSV